jgi:NAD(P)-dependent dehydrogenase (short-subunit alcohol dehydrogenase family)
LEASAKVYDLDDVEAFAAQQPIGRLLEPSEIAASIVWLCSSAASAITGADIAVDGGMTVS